jgi:hypothetical protein
MPIRCKVMSPSDLTRQWWMPKVALLAKNRTLGSNFGSTEHLRIWTSAEHFININHIRPRGGVVTQRSAKPFTPVQFRAWPPKKSNT